MSWTTNIQWKGTFLCMDVHCPNCGEGGHIDGDFASAIACRKCGAVYKMPTDVPLERTHMSKVLKPLWFGCNDDHSKTPEER